MPTKANGPAIRRLREALGLNCSQLAQQADLGRELLWKIENELLDGSAATRLKIANALAVPVTDITYEVPRQRRAKQAA